MSFEVTGKVYRVLETQVISDKFKKREFVIETEGQYPQLVKFQALNDATMILDKVKVGQNLTVFFNLSGRAYNKEGKEMFFTNLNAWRIKAAESVEKPAPALQEVKVASFDNDDLPF